MGKKHNWAIAGKENDELELCYEITERYSEIPKEYEVFMKK